jgi:hypothetical protein
MSALANLNAGSMNGDSSHLQSAFLTFLPRIETHARAYFRHLRRPQGRADAVQESIALAWLWFLRATARGKDVSAFVGLLAAFAVRQVRCGRRLCGQERARDVFSRRARRRHGFSLSSLPAGRGRDGLFSDALADNTVTPVPDQVAFRLDFPAWLEGYGERDRGLILDLLAGERTKDAARKHGLSAARVSQLRRSFLEDWQRHGATPESECRSAAVGRA